MPPHRTAGMTTPLQQSTAVPVLEERAHARKQPVAGDSRSFPGQPGYGAVSGAAIRANRSLSDDRGKVLSMSSFPHPGEEEDEDGEPLLKSAWMSLVGAAGKFLGRAQERHQWSEARVGMMNRLLSKNKSGSGISFHADEEGGSRTQLQRPVSISKASVSTAAHLEHEASHSSVARGSGGVSTSAATRAGTDWPDSASYVSGLAQRDFKSMRERESSDRSLPQLTASGSHVMSSSALPTVRFQQAEAVSPGWAMGRPSADQSLETCEPRDGRRLMLDIRKRQQAEDPRQSGSGSASTRNSIPIMPPLGRNNSSQHLQVQEPAEDHLHGLLQKLRARRLGQEAASADLAAMGPGPSPRRHAMHAPLESPTPPDAPPGLRRLGGPAGGPGSGSRLMRQRFSALLASDIERQVRPPEASRQRHSALVGMSVCDSSTSERVSSWLASAISASCEPPPDNDEATLESGPTACSDGTAFSRGESMERDSEQDRLSYQQQMARRLTHNGTEGGDSSKERVPEIRPWKSMNGGQSASRIAEEEVPERSPQPPPMPPPGTPGRSNSQRVHFAAGVAVDQLDRQGEGSPRARPPEDQ